MHEKVTRIVVLADTHHRKVEQLSPALSRVMNEADLVVHLGDFTSIDLVQYFLEMDNFCGVAGNHDSQAIKSILPASDVIDIHGKRIGIVHGCWSPVSSTRRMMKRFRGIKLDDMLYGHTHLIRNEIMNDVLVFNPGSAAGRFPASWSSYGVLTVSSSLQGEIVTLMKEVPVSLPGNAVAVA